MKLPLQEVEHEALRRELSSWDGYIASALLGTEGIRACARYGPRYADLARSWLEGVALLPITDELLSQAADLAPLKLRSLDAVHLATALSVQSEIGALITYDERLANAARDYELPVLAPGV